MGKLFISSQCLFLRLSLFLFLFLSLYLLKPIFSVFSTRSIVHIIWILLFCSEQNDDNTETVMTFHKITSCVPVMSFHRSWFGFWLFVFVVVIFVFFYKVICSHFRFHFDSLSMHLIRTSTCDFILHMQFVCLYYMDGGTDFDFENISLKLLNAMKTIVNGFQLNYKTKPTLSTVCICSFDTNSNSPIKKITRPQVIPMSIWFGSPLCVRTAHVKTLHSDYI